jgi:hypothetical protein
MTSKDEDIRERSRLLADMAYYQRKGWKDLCEYTKETCLFLSDKIITYDYTKDEERLERMKALEKYTL